MQSPLSERTALAGGVLAGIGASACCVGPLLLVSAGIGGAWIANLVAMERYRLVFVALAVVFLALAFRRVYAKRPACDVGAACEAEGAARGRKLMFWAGALLVVAIVALPWLIPVFYR